MTQPSPLQPSHLLMSDQPKRADQHMGGKPQAAASWTALSGSCQHVSSRHSMKEQGSHVTAQAASQSPVESSAALEKPSPAQNALVPEAGQPGSQLADCAAKLDERAIAGRSPEEELREVAQSCAEKQQLREAMQLLHSVACQISEHQNAPLQPLQPSQLRHRSQQPSQDSQPVAAGRACGLIVDEPRSQHLLPATPLPQSRPERQAEQASYAAVSAQQAGCQDASQWKQSYHCSSGRDPYSCLQRHLAASTQAAVCREQSSPLQLFPGSPALTDIQTTNDSSINVGGPEDIPGLGLCLPRLTTCGQPDQPGQMAPMGQSTAAEGNSDSATANGSGHASRGSQEQPEPSQQMPAKQESATEPGRHHSSASRENPEHVSTCTESPEHGDEVIEEQAAPSEQMRASQKDATDAQHNLESTGTGHPGHVSTGREDQGEHDSKDTQNTQVEGEEECEGQAELKLSFQLSSEDQDLACGQEQAASEQRMTFKQQPAGEAHCSVSPHVPDSSYCKGFDDFVRSDCVQSVAHAVRVNHISCTRKPTMSRCG